MLPEVIGSSEIQTSIKKHQDYHLDAAYSYRNISMGKVIDYDIKLPEMEFKSKAKITDFVECIAFSGQFLVFSEKAINVIRNLNLPPFDVYPLKIYKRDKLFNYYCLHLKEDIKGEHINWDSTTFSIINKSDKKKRSIQYKSFQDYFDDCKSKASDFLILPSDVVLKKTIPYDIFFSRFSGFNRFGVLCNSKLPIEVINNNLTGFRFIEATT